MEAQEALNYFDRTNIITGQCSVAESAQLAIEGLQGTLPPHLEAADLWATQCFPVSGGDSDLTGCFKASFTTFLKVLPLHPGASRVFQ